MRDNDYILETIAGREEYTTNNRMELKAILEAIKWITKQPISDNIYTIYSDSAYCVNICNDWIYNWAKNDWKNSKKQQVENYELIKELWSYINTFQNFAIKKISGHKGISGNEIADALATDNYKKFNKILNENNIMMNLKNF